MTREKNECIAVKAFAALVLDYEWPEQAEWNIPASVSCRVLIEDVFQKRIFAETREQAIKMFLSGEWKAAQI